MLTAPASERTLAELVTENPARALVLDRIGLDFCCHGNRSLSEACAAAGLDAAEVTVAFDEVADEVPADWTGGGRGELAAYVESNHHRYLHEELEPLQQLAAKVRSVHGGRHPELEEVASVVAEIAADFRPHLATEETEVFPAIAALTRGAAADAPLAAQIDDLVTEHAVLGSKLARLRELTRGYTVPSDGCASYQWLYERLAHLESDTHIHVHLENNVLFPAALVEAV